MENIILFKEFFLDINENKKPEDLGKSFIHRVLNLPGDKKIEKVYKDSPRKLAEDLLLSIKRTRMIPPFDIRRKAMGMIEFELFSQNWPSRKKVRNPLMDKAFAYIKTIDVPGIPKLK